MKKTTCILVCSILSLSAYSQKTLSTDYAYTVSEPYRVIDADSKWYFSHGNGILTLKFDGKETYIQTFDANKPEFKTEKKYEKYFPKNYVLESIKEINDKFYVFFSSWDGDNDKEQLFSQEVDFAKGEFTGSPKLMFQVDGKVSGSYSGRMMDFNVVDKFQILPSFDKKNFLVKYRRKPEVKNDKKSFDIIGLYAYDGNLNKLSNKEITMPYTERRMDNLDYQIDNKGNLYMLSKIYHDDSNDDKKNRKDEEANYHVELFTVKTGSDNLNITKIDNKDKFISGLWIFDSPTGGLIAGGYYNNGKGKNFSKNCDGIMTFKMKEDGTISDQFYYEIPLELINQYESEKTKKKNDKKEEKGEGAKVTDLKLKNLEVRKDGSVLLVGEQDFVIAHTSTMMSAGGGMSTRTYYTYHYNDIIVTKIKPDGKLAWMKKVPKQQVGSKGQGGMSYKFFNNASDDFLVFLDNVKNIDLPDDKQPALHSDGQGGYLTAVKMNDNTGDYKKGSILNAREVEDFKLYQFSTDRVIKTSETTFVLEAYKKKKEDVMIKVTLK